MESLVLRSRRRLIERPRLLRALDRSTANLRTIVASAGYGKTTLAEQWAAVPGRRVGWYRARTSASDVSVVARGFVEAASSVVPGAGRRLLERLAVTSDPDRDAAILAEMLAADLAAWPEDGWIVVDDFQLLQAAPDPETFVETLVANAPVQLLLVGRNRPRWVTSRDVLYGDVLELGRAALAMNADEIDEMLGDDAGELAAGLLALADGWPAVVALSAAAGHADLPPTTAVPEELFDFFAEEVFRVLPETTQAGLMALAGVPLIDAEVAVTLLGEGMAVRVLENAAEMGLVATHEGRYELHPLAASFVERHNLRWADHQSSKSAETDRVFHLYLSRGDWDAAYALAARRDAERLLPLLLEKAVPQLIAAGRLVTLEQWIAATAATGLSFPAVRLAEAEICLRHGRSTTALTLLRDDVERPPAERNVAFAVLITAARALHIAARENEAHELFERALLLAESREERRVALEGTLGCAAALEKPVAHTILEELADITDQGSPLEVIRLADRTLSLGLRFGRNRRREVSGIMELTERTEDPFARMSFLCLWGWANVLSCRYENALEVASKALDEIDQYRVELAETYVRIVKAAALSGIQRHDDAIQEVLRALASAERICDVTGTQNAQALHVRILVAAGLAERACALEPPDVEGAIPFAAGEVLASRALALATCGRVVEASSLADEARSVSHGVETRVVAAASKAICVLKSRASSTFEALNALMDEAYGADALDGVVVAYRGNPELLAALYDNAGTRDRARYMVERAGDSQIAAALNLAAAAPRGPRGALSPRELEVFELLCDGRSNSEISKRLFIAESTVKAHVHRIFDKVGIRSRSALAIGEAMHRYAASAENARSSETGS